MSLSIGGERGQRKATSKTLERRACQGRESWVLKGKVARGIISNRERDRARTGTSIGLGIRAILRVTRFQIREDEEDEIFSFFFFLKLGKRFIKKLNNYTK